MAVRWNSINSYTLPLPFLHLPFTKLIMWQWLKCPVSLTPSIYNGQVIVTHQYPCHHTYNVAWAKQKWRLAGMVIITIKQKCHVKLAECLAISLLPLKEKEYSSMGTVQNVMTKMGIRIPVSFWLSPQTPPRYVAILYKNLLEFLVCSGHLPPTHFSWWACHSDNINNVKCWHVLSSTLWV